MMKRKLENKFHFIANSLNSYKFKAIFLILVILSIYGVFDIAIRTGFFYGLYMIYNNQWVIAILLFCLFVNTLNICELYKKNYSIIIRNKTKKEYLKEISKIIIITNTIVILMSFMITCIFLFFKYAGDFSVGNTINGVNILFYTIYHFIRFIIISSLLSLLIFYCWKFLNSFFSFLISIILSLSLVISPISLEIVTHFKMFFGYYLLAPRFENITLDIQFSLLTIIIIMIIDLVLFQIINYVKRDIG